MLLYFFPDANRVDVDTFRTAGLGHAVEDTSRITSRRCPERGPSGGPGVVAVIDPSLDAAVGFFADRQRWRQVPGSTAWVGIETDRPTEPAELARRHQLTGHPVEMADGREWLVPIARAFAEQDGQPGIYCALPERSTLDDAGHWQAGEVVDRYRTLWTIAEAWDEALHASQSEETEHGTLLATFEFEGVHQKAMAVLGYNYRIGPAEADLLGLLSQQHCARVLHATIDMPSRMAWQEKKTDEAPAGGDS